MLDVDWRKLSVVESILCFRTVNLFKIFLVQPVQERQNSFLGIHGVWAAVSLLAAASHFIRVKQATVGWLLYYWSYKKSQVIIYCFDILTYIINWFSFLYLRVFCQMASYSDFVWYHRNKHYLVSSGFLHLPFNSGLTNFSLILFLIILMNHFLFRTISWISPSLSLIASVFQRHTPTFTFPVWNKVIFLGNLSTLSLIKYGQTFLSCNSCPLCCTKPAVMSLSEQGLDLPETTHHQPPLPRPISHCTLARHLAGP